MSEKTYRQCMLRRHDGFGTIHEVIVPVIDHLAKVGRDIRHPPSSGDIWTIIHVGPLDDEPQKLHTKHN